MGYINLDVRGSISESMIKLVISENGITDAGVVLHFIGADGFRSAKT